MIYKGIAVSPGLILAKCLILEEQEPGTFNRKLACQSDVEPEKAKVNAAIEKVSACLEAVREKAEADGASDSAEVVETHIMLLQDPMLLDAVMCKIEKDLISAPGAVQQTIEEQAALFENMEDPYFKERSQDVRDIGRRLMNTLLGIEEKEISNLKEDTILVSKNITPSQMAAADKKRVKGIISETGGKTSHTAILARNMEIPAVFGCSGISGELDDGVLVALNGSIGTVLTELTSEQETELSAEIEKMSRIRAVLKEMADKPSKTKDGVEISICANIMNPEDLAKVLEVGADGIGLYRTEFLFMDRSSAPTEEEQYSTYKRVLEAMGEKPVIIRTMDIGGDKEIDYLKLPKEENPFIGYRAIRICLNDKELFKIQLRAILRASAHGKAMIMYPMISSVEEIRAANAVLEEAKTELRCKGLKFDESIPVGIMIEVPSAAVTADILIKEADFFSIGTNDLTQYTLAVDRMNEKLSSLYNPYQPGVLRLIKGVIEASKKAGGQKFTGMCGEFAGDPAAAILLLGMGLDEFSVNQSSLLKIRKLISMVDMSFAKEVSEKAMELSTAKEIEEYLHKVTAEVMGEFLV